MVRVILPQVSQPFIDDKGIITKPWQRFLSQLFIRTGQEVDLVNASASAGDIKATGASTAPDGWLLCDGSAVSRTTYATLFAAISTTYGIGNGSTTFNLPDGRGRSLIGAGAGAGLTSRALGDTGGAETHTLTIAEMARHAHALTNGANVVNSDAGTEYEATAGTKGTVVTASVDKSGSDQPHNNMQPFFVANWIIKT